MFPFGGRGCSPSLGTLVINSDSITMVQKMVSDRKIVHDNCHLKERCFRGAFFGWCQSFSAEGGIQSTTKYCPARHASQSRGFASTARALTSVPGYRSKSFIKTTEPFSATHATAILLAIGCYTRLGWSSVRIFCLHTAPILQQPYGCRHYMETHHCSGRKLHVDI